MGAVFCEPVNIKLQMMHSCLSNHIATKREVLSVRANTIACIWVLQIDELPVKTGSIRVCKFTMLKILFILRHTQVVLYQIFLGRLFQSHSRLIHATPGSALCAFRLGARTSHGNEVTLYSRLLQKTHWVHPKNVQGFLTDSSSDSKTPTQNYSSSYISRLLLGNLPFGQHSQMQNTFAQQHEAKCRVYSLHRSDHTKDQSISNEIFVS